MLRRMTQALREQNWTTILVEFVLLIAGVFLGIQAANWNEQRLDQRLSQRYLADIAMDVRSDLTELARVQDSAMDRIAASTYILQHAGIALPSSEVRISGANIRDLFSNSASIMIPETRAPPEVERTRLWELAFTMYAFDLNRAAYDALVGAGKFDLITDPKVMRLLREYYYLVNVLDRSQHRTSFPIRNTTLEIGMMHGLSPGLTVDEDALIAKVRETPALAASVASSRQFAGMIFLLSKVQQRKGEELLQALEAGGTP